MDIYSLLLYYIQESSKSFHECVIFEAGFGDLGPIIELYHRHPFNKYIGIETINESEVFVTFPNPDGKGRTSGGTYLNDGLYEKYENWCQHKPEIVQKKLSKIEFSHKFQLKLNTKIEEFIAEDRKQKIEI